MFKVAVTVQQIMKGLNVAIYEEEKKLLSLQEL
jgi:hypothetical protein